MLRIILFLFCFALFASANSCDFSDKNQKECNLDINNPPVFLHKFIDAGNNTYTKYDVCIYDGKFEYKNIEYDVIDCSMIADGELLTEGVVFENNDEIDNNSLKTNKEISLENDNIMLVLAGDVVIDSGVRINTKNPKNLILEIIEGTNGKGTLTLNEGAKINAEAIIMPNGANATITLNTFFGEEKDFIDTIDVNNMDTNLSVNEIHAVNPQDGSITAYNGNIICGPKVDPSVDSSSEIFIEGGKVISKNSLDLANIQGQNSGKCNSPVQLAFNEETTKSQIESTESTITANEITSEEYTESNIEDSSVASAESNAESSVESSTTESVAESSTESVAIESSAESNNNDFAIIEQDIFDKYTKLCNGNLECLNKSIEPYKNIIWNKISSQNKINSIYIINLTNNRTKVQCEVVDYYDKNLDFSFDLSNNNSFEKIDLVFPKSNNKTKIICQNENLKAETNPIQVNPANFDLIHNFGSENLDMTLSLKAGVINISFEGSKALNLEGEIDTGFNGRLLANNENLKFTQNKCGYPNDDVFIQDSMIIGFKNGKADKYLTSFMANTITNGDLSIDFDIEGDLKKCGGELEPKCTQINITKNINVIPDNFMIYTAITSPYKVAYYGQLEDRNAFKYNPILNIQINAINNQDEIIDINKRCNHGIVELNLDSESQIEFKRSITDRLNSKINIYLDEFDTKQGANVDMYFGIGKTSNSYKNITKLTQSSLIEPREIKLTDLAFYVRFKSNGKTYDYSDAFIYDQLAEDSKPAGVLFARGKIEKNISYTDDKKANLDLKYLIYCKDCDTKILEKYLNIDGITMDSPNWYINREHPSDFYLRDDFIDTKLEIENSNQVLEGRQQIIFDSQENGEYKNTINQKDVQFAPYLNYNKDFKNTYLENEFIVTIEKEEISKEPNIEENIEENTEPKVEEQVEEKIEQKVEQKPAKQPQKPIKQTKPKSPNSVELDIEE